MSPLGTTPIRTRPAEPRDKLIDVALVRDFTTSFVPERAVVEANLALLIERDDTLLVIAEDQDDDEGVVGYLLASTHLTHFANGRVAWVEEVMVAEASRRAAASYSALGYDDSAVFFTRSLRP